MGILGGPDTPAIETDPTTAVGMVRLLITDVSPESALFTDDEIQAFLALQGDSVKRAAAAALSTIARSEVLISKKISTQDLTTDGPAVAKELRASAADLLAEAAFDDDRYGIDIVPMWSFPECRAL